MTRREKDALLRNGRQTKQERLDKVPSTSIGRESRSRYMGIERELLAKRQMLQQEAHKKYDELDIIHQRICETNAEIEQAREKQIVNTFHLEEPW